MPLPLAHFHAVAAPMLIDNIDTDQLSPSWSFKTGLSSFGYALFGNQRYLDEMGLTPNPEFILNQEPYRRAGILVAGSNFGCGSSRETAVWALRDSGYRVVIGVSFNETFKRNCIVNGMAPLAVDRTVAELLNQAILQDPERGLAVDLEQNSIWIGESKDREPKAGGPFSFTLDPFYRSLLVSGNTEDEMLGTLQPGIDARRSGLLEEWPWLRSVGLPARKAEPFAHLHQIGTAG